MTILLLIQMLKMNQLLTGCLVIMAQQYNIPNNIPVIMTLKVMVSIPAGLKAVTEYRPLSLGS